MGKRIDVLFYCCIVCIIGLAIFFRSQGYFNGAISFWVDEAMWADNLITKPLNEVINIRPVGYMFLTKLLTKISKDEITFRMISYLSSILAIPLIFLIAKRIWKSKVVILLLVFLVAFNPYFNFICQRIQTLCIGLFSTWVPYFSFTTVY